MRIISWNCNMAFRNKADQVLRHNPDIIIISEAENKEKIDFSKHILNPTQSIWIGENPNKGLLIASYNKDLHIEIRKEYSTEFKYIIPINVKSRNLEFILFAVWTQNAGSTYSSYIVQAYRALKYYNQILNDKSIITGDFNSNKIWDNGDKKEATHSDLVSLLQEHKISSLYHLYNKEQFGEESAPTLFLQKNKLKPYHVDYIFTGDKWTSLLNDIKIGNYQEWSNFSDHMPIIVSFTND